MPTTVTLAVASEPEAVLAVATSVFSPVAIGTSATHWRPYESAATPLTLTPTSSRSPSSVPRTRTAFPSMDAPAEGNVMAMPDEPPTVNARAAGVGSTLPAGSRATTSKT